MTTIDIPRDKDNHPLFAAFAMEITARIIPVMNGQVFQEALEQAYKLGREDERKWPTP